MDCSIAYYCICCTLSGESQCDKAGNGLFLPILPNDQDSNRSDFAGSGIYALFGEPERLDDEGVDGKDGNNEAESMVTRSDDGRPFFLIKRFEMRLKARISGICFTLLP